MDALYRSEINCSIESFWDMGFDVKVGDDQNGFKAEKTFRPGQWDAAARWLDAATRECYPDSQYALEGVA